MGRVAISVCLLQGSKSCSSTPIAVEQFVTDEMNTLTAFRKEISNRTGKIVHLMYRGEPVSAGTKVYHFATAASHVRFSARLMEPVTTSAHSALSGHTAAETSTPSALSGSTAHQLFVQTLFGKKLTLQVEFSTSIDTVKSMIQDREEDDLTLADYNIQSEETVYLAILQGGGASPFVDLSKGSALQAVNFSTAAPSWRVCTRGLNVEGKCANITCCAFGQMVIDPKGMVSWSLIADQAQCPRCRQQFQPITCGFFDCVWAFDGRKAGNGGAVEDVSGSWQRASDQQYYRFQEHSNQASWDMLVLSAKRAHEKSVANICPICWSCCEGITDTTSCGHCFHPNCLALWKEAQPSVECPLCGVLMTA